MTRATINEKPGFITLRIKFAAGYVVNITEGRSAFKITSSSPKFLVMIKTDEGRAAFFALSKIEMASKGRETTAQKMERFRALAERSENLIDFVQTAKLME